MAQNWSPKRQNWVQRFSDTTVAFLALADQLATLCSEYSSEAYGTGGQNAITDAEAQAVLPATTALSVAQAEGAYIGADAVYATITANRGYLEAVRP